MRGDVSRRRVLEAGGVLFSGGFLTKSGSVDANRQSSVIEGWVTKGSRTDIAGEDGTVESFRYFGSSLCNDGDVFACQTCTGAEFYLLVSLDSTSPTVGETYRFRQTGKNNICGNFPVRLLKPGSCGELARSTTDGTDIPTETTNDTPIQTTSDTPTDTPTERPIETPTDPPIQTPRRTRSETTTTDPTDDTVTQADNTATSAETPSDDTGVTVD